MVTREAAYYNRELLAFDEFFFVCLIFARVKRKMKKKCSCSNKLAF